MAPIDDAGTEDKEAPKMKAAADAMLLAAQLAERPWERKATQLPYECWQFCHLLWKYDFSVSHLFSPLGDQIYILLGLPYHILLEEAIVAKFPTRLDKTPGTTKFDEVH